MASFKKEVVIDGRGHILGRLSCIVAKQLLLGQKVTVVRCEAINMSNTLFRRQLKYAEFKRKTNNVNPKHGPFHYRCPSKMFYRVLRGMVPHKTARGAAALDRLTVFEGCPHPYDTKKKLVCPQALKVLRIKPYRKFCVLGDLSSKFGWKQAELVKKLEDKRRVRAAGFFVKKKAITKAVSAGKAAAAGNSKLFSKDEKALLEKCGQL